MMMMMMMMMMGRASLTELPGRRRSFLPKDATLQFKKNKKNNRN